jgi:uncharacterized membrane protein YagU involved in acid resistance
MTKLNATIAAGIGGTAIMSTVSSLIGMAGGPQMNSALLLSYMLNVPQIAGWIFHFAVGILFALIYTFLIKSRLSRISSSLGKGTIFGLIAFVVAVISLPAMGAIFGRMPQMVASVPAMMAVSIVEHMVFGIAVVLIFDKVSA